MFEVRCISPVDDQWEERDKLIEEAAGRKADHSGAGHSTARKVPERDHLWLVPNFELAQSMKKALEKIDQVSVTCQEHVSDNQSGKKKR